MKIQHNPPDAPLPRRSRNLPTSRLWLPIERADQLIGDPFCPIREEISPVDLSCKAIQTIPVETRIHSYNKVCRSSWPKRVREDAWMTQRELAKYIQVTQGNLSFWENGRHKPKKPSLLKWMDFLVHQCLISPWEDQILDPYAPYIVDVLYNQVASHISSLVELYLNEHNVKTGLTSG